MRQHRRSRFLGTLLTLSALSMALIVPTGASAAAPAVTTTTTTAACAETGWPAWSEGRPASFKSGARWGEYLWHTSNGWRLRVTKPGTLLRTFSGKIVSDVEMIVTSYHLESNDHWTLSADKKTLTYRFRNYGNVDGLNIKADCATRLWVRGSRSGVKLPVGRIWIGHDGHHPLTNPFEILRTL